MPTSISLRCGRFEIKRGKKKVLRVGYESDPEPILTLDGTTIDICNIYDYFGLPTLSSKVVIYLRFATAWSAIRKLHIFHLTTPDALKITLFKSAVKAIATYALEPPPLKPTTSNMLNAGRRQMICAAVDIDWQNNIMNKEVYTKSHLLPFCQSIQKRRLCLIGHSLCLQGQSITTLRSMLPDHNAVFSVWGGQGRTWTFEKDLLNGLNANDCPIDDAINLSSSQFTCLVVSFNSNFYC